MIDRVKQPFIDWTNSLDGGPSAKLRTCEPTLMLVTDRPDSKLLSVGSRVAK